MRKILTIALIVGITETLIVIILANPHLDKPRVFFLGFILYCLSYIIMSELEQRVPPDSPNEHLGF